LPLFSTILYCWASWRFPFLLQNPHHCSVLEQQGVCFFVWCSGWFGWFCCSFFWFLFYVWWLGFVCCFWWFCWGCIGYLFLCVVCHRHTFFCPFFFLFFMVWRCHSFVFFAPFFHLPCKWTVFVFAPF
jgi:hypothetical protein